MWPRFRSRPEINRHPRRSGGQTRLQGAEGSSGPNFPAGLPKGEITKMNSIAGKSTGIALLMAAAMLAALFSMGVFSASGVGANAKANPAPTAELDIIVPEEDEVTLTVTFQINDDIDGAATGTQADDNVTIDVPENIAEILTTFDTDNISVTQGGKPVGKVVDPIETAQEIVITVADDGDQNVVKDETVTVTISDLTLEAAAATGDVTIYQTGQAIAARPTASLSIYDWS